MSHNTRPTELLDRASSIESDRPADPPARRFDLSFPQTVAGALAAASAAVAASWLGVAGTVVGAIVASLVASVSTALYKRPLELSHEVVLQTLPTLQDRQRFERASSVTRETMAMPSQPQSHDAHRIPVPAPAATPPRGASRWSGLRRLNWGAVAVSAVVTLVAGLFLLTGVETVLGQSVSSLLGHGSGGSTVSRILDKAKPDPGNSHPKDNSPNTDGETSGTTTDPPSSESPSTEAPSTEAPSTEAPSTEAPSTEAPSTEAPTTTPSTDARPTPEAGGTTAPETLDAQAQG